MKQWKKCQSDIWRDERNMFIFFLIQVFSELQPAFRLHPPQPPSHPFSAPPPATHFDLINDPPPTPRWWFYRLLCNVWPAMTSVIAVSNCSWSDASLMLMVNSVVTSSIWNSLFNAVAYEWMCPGVPRITKEIHLPWKWCPCSFVRVESCLLSLLGRTRRVENLCFCVSPAAKSDFNGWKHLGVSLYQ